MSKHDDESEWIGVDLDGTLAYYDKWDGVNIGEPIPQMVNRVKKWIADGILVKIFTARAAEAENIYAIKTWCQEHIGTVLEITNKKDKRMIQLWDDRAVRVVKNQGRIDRDVDDIEGIDWGAYGEHDI